MDKFEVSLGDEDLFDGGSGGIDGENYTLKTDFDTHVNSTAKHPTAATQTYWNLKLDEIDLYTREGELKTCQPSMTSSDSDVDIVARWIGIGQKDVQVEETNTRTVWELTQVQIKCCDTTHTGVGEKAFYLGIWEAETPSSSTYIRVAVSTNAVKQKVGQTGIWNFNKSVIHHRNLRLALLEARDGVWPSDDWHLIGAKGATRTSATGNQTFYQNESGQHINTYTPVVTFQYSLLKSKCETQSSRTVTAEIEPPIIWEGVFYDDMGYPSTGIATYIGSAPASVPTVLGLTLVGGQTTFSESDYMIGTFVSGGNDTITNTNYGVIITKNSSITGNNHGIVLNSTYANAGDMKNNGIALLAGARTLNSYPQTYFSTSGIACVTISGNSNDFYAQPYNSTGNMGILLVTYNDTERNCGLFMQNANNGVIISGNEAQISTSSNFYGTIIGSPVNYSSSYSSGDAEINYPLIVGDTITDKGKAFSGTSVGVRITFTPTGSDESNHDGVTLGKYVSMTSTTNSGIIISSKFNAGGENDNALYSVKKNHGLIITGYQDYLPDGMQERNNGLVIAPYSISFPNDEENSGLATVFSGNVKDKEGTYILKDGVFQDGGISVSGTSVVIGDPDVIAANNTVVIGTEINDKNVPQDSVVIGARAQGVAMLPPTENNGYAVAVGSQAYAGFSGTAVGASAEANGEYSTAIGSAAKANAPCTVAIGASAQNNKRDTVLIQTQGSGAVSLFIFPGDSEYGAKYTNHEPGIGFFTESGLSGCISLKELLTKPFDNGSGEADF